MTEDRSTDRPVGSELTIPTGRMLYYPCSGRDFSQPIRTFANDVDTFWFADTSYLHRFPSGVERGRLQLPPIFEVVGHSKQNLQLPNENEAPAIQIQWQHRRSERLIDAWFLSMDAVSVFRELQSARKPISVFWHRRDGTGEGGSNLWWLHPNPGMHGAPGFLDDVLASMANHGQIVSDGSNAMTTFQLEKKNQCDSEPPQDAVHEFEYKQWRLKIVRDIHDQGSPTLVWEVGRGDREPLMNTDGR